MMWLLVPLVHLIYKAVEIDGDNINREIALLQSDMISIPLQVAVMESSILCLDIIMSFV